MSRGKECLVQAVVTILPNAVHPSTLLYYRIPKRSVKSTQLGVVSLVNLTRLLY